MINDDKALKELRKLIGTKFDYDEISIAVDNVEPVIVNRLIGQDIFIEGYGRCECYNAYEDCIDIELSRKATIFVIYVSIEDNIIADISTYRN